MEKIFYVLYVKDRLAGPCVDLIRLISNPNASAPSHVTIRGPYRKLASEERSWISYNPGAIKIAGLGNFFETGQNTVFLYCDIHAIRDVWYKPDFPRGVPHITLYDGSSATFARQLFRRLQSFDWQLRVKVGSLEPLVMSHQRRLPIWSNELSGLYFEIAHREFAWDDLQLMDDEARLALVCDVARYLHRKHDECRCFGPAGAE